MMKTITFGEIMVRMCPPGFERFRQAMPGKICATFAGAEANVAVSLAILGGRAAFVTALPEHLVADACIGNLQSFGVDVSAIQRVAEGRLGLYYVERGANQRPGRVIYDRDGSSVAVTPPERYPWDEIFVGADWFHFTGITPALSENAADCSLVALKKAKEHGVTVSCDLNYRSKLWNWKKDRRGSELAGEVMRGLLPYVDLLIANESDAADVLGIYAGASDVDRGKLELERYPEVAAKIATEFPGIRRVAITLRESISASHNNWGAMLYDAAAREAFFAPLDAEGAYRPYGIKSIVDRVGAGDSFGAALIFALQTPSLSEARRAIGFAAAASCLAHSVDGDFNLNQRSEVDALLSGSTSGRVIR